MADPIYEIPEKPVYDPAIRALQDSDPARATTIFNPVLGQMIVNTHAVKLESEANAKRIEEVSKQAGEAAKSAKAYSHTVTASGWKQGAAASDGSYWQEFSVANSEITVGDVVLVIPGDATAEAFFKASVRGFVDTYAGGFKLSASATPTANFTIYYTISKQEV